MAFLGQEFSTDTLPQSESNFDPLPAGWYTAVINGAEVKPTKDGTGSYISLKYGITGPSHQGRVVFGMLNIRNKNPKAEEIGLQQLGELMRASGLQRVTDSDQLIGANLQIKLAIETQEGYEPKNVVKGFKAVAGGSAAPVNFTHGVPQKNQQTTSTPTATTTSASAAPPWAKR